MEMLRFGGYTVGILPQCVANIAHNVYQRRILFGEKLKRHSNVLPRVLATMLCAVI